MHRIGTIFLDVALKPGSRPDKFRVAWHLGMLALMVSCIFLTAILRIYNVTFPGERAVLIAVDVIFALDIILRLIAHATVPRQNDVVPMEGGRGKRQGVSLRLVFDLVAAILPTLVHVGILTNTLWEFARVVRVYRMVSRKDALFPYAKQMYTEHRFIVPNLVPKIKKWGDDMMLIAALATIGLFWIESASHHKIFWIDVTSIAFDLLFMLDYSLRVVFSGHATETLSLRQRSGETRGHFNARKLLTPIRQSVGKALNNYVLRWYGIVDLMAWVFPVAYHMFNFGLLAEEYARLARFFRIMRTARLLRLLRAFRWFKETMHLRNNMAQFFKFINKELIASVVIMFVLIAAGTLYLMEMEGAANPAFKDPFKAVLWSISSVLGQPDNDGLVYQSSRFIAIGILFCGIIATGFVTGSITTYIINRMDNKLMGNDQMNGKGHVVICGYNSRLSELISQLFAGKTTSTIVLLFDRDNEKEDIISDMHLEDVDLGTKHDVLWVRGNPRSSADLHKAGVDNACSVIILADETNGLEDEEDRDALSLMTLEILSDFLDNPTAAYHDPKNDGPLEMGIAKFETIRRWMKKDNSWTWKKLTSRDTTIYTKSANGRPSITIELLSSESVRVARRLTNKAGVRKVDHIVYADDLICKYITLENSTGNAVDVYDDILDPQSVEMLQFRISIQGEWMPSDLWTEKPGTMPHSKGCLDFIQEYTYPKGLIFLGIKIHESVICEWLKKSSNPESDGVLEWKYQAIVNDGYLRSKVEELYRQVMLDPAAHLEKVRSEGWKDVRPDVQRPPDYITILNPSLPERRILCEDLCQTAARLMLARKEQALQDPLLLGVAMRTVQQKSPDGYPELSIDMGDCQNHVSERS